MSNNLLDIISEATKTDAEIYSTAAKVIEVDEDEKTCDVEPIDGSAPILRVKLQAGESETPFLQIPEIDSFVLVTFLSKETAFVSMFSEIKEIKIRGDQYGGLIKIEELKKQLEIVTSRLDTLYDAIDNGTTAAQDGGATLLASMKVITALQLKTEDFSDIENENIKHG